MGRSAIIFAFNLGLARVHFDTPQVANLVYNNLGRAREGVGGGVLFLWSLGRL